MPDWRAEVRQRLSGLQLEPVRAAEIVEELAQHLEDRHLELRSRGAGLDDARREVLAELSEGELLSQALAGIERRAGPGPLPLGAGNGDGWLSPCCDVTRRPKPPGNPTSNQL